MTTPRSGGSDAPFPITARPGKWKIGLDDTITVLVIEMTSGRSVIVGPQDFPAVAHALNKAWDQNAAKGITVGKDTE